MSDYSGLIAELQRSCNGLNNKVKSLEEKVEYLGDVVVNGYKEKGPIPGVEINYPSLIEINNKQKEQIEALESVLLDDEGDSWIEIFNKAIFDKDGFNEIRNLEEKIEALKESVKKLEGKQQMNKEEIKIIIKALEHCRFCSNVNYPLGNNREVKEIINKLRKQLEEDE